MLFIFHKNRHIGLDVASQTINAVALVNKKGRVCLTDFEYSYFNSDDTAGEIKRFIEQHRKIFHGKFITASFTDDDIVYRIIRLPAIAKNDLENLIDNELERIIPFKPTDTIYDYQIIDTDNATGEYVIFLVAKKKDTLLKYKSYFKNTHIKSNVQIGSKNTADINCTYFNHRNIFKNNTVAVIDISKETTLINVIDSEKILFSRNLSIGMQNVKTAVLRNHKIKAHEVTATLRKIPLDNSTENLNYLQKAILETVKIILEIMLKEIEISLKYYQKNFQHEVKHIFLTGEISNLPGVESYFQNILHFQTVVGDNFKQIDLSLIEHRKNEFENNKSYYNTAVGLALRTAIANNLLDINLDAREEKIQKNKTLKRKRVIYAAASILFLFAAVHIISLSIKKSFTQLKTENTQLHEKLEGLKLSKTDRETFQKRISWFEKETENIFKSGFIIDSLKRLNLSASSIQYRKNINNHEYTITLNEPSALASKIYRDIYDLNIFSDIRIVRIINTSQFIISLTLEQ